MNEELKKEILSLVQSAGFILAPAWNLAAEHDLDGGVFDYLDRAVDAIGNAKKMLNPEPKPQSHD